MSTEFTMPKLGLTMEEGTIIEWLVPDGTDVDDGSPVLRDRDRQGGDRGRHHGLGALAAAGRRR